MGQSSDIVAGIPDRMDSEVIRHSLPAILSKISMTVYQQRYSSEEALVTENRDFNSHIIIHIDPVAAQRRSLIAAIHITKAALRKLIWPV